MAGSYPSSLAPGEKGEVPISVDTKKLHGAFTKTITIETNDPTRPTSTVSLSGTLRTWVELSPHSASFGQLMTEAFEERKITISAGTAEPLEVSVLSSPTGGYVSAELRPIQPGRRYELVVQTLPPLPVGMLTDKVRLQTNMERQGTIDVDIRANVTARIAASPETLRIGQVTTEQQHQIQIRNNGSTPINILDVISDDPDLTIEVGTSDPAGKNFQLHVNVPADWEPKDNKATIWVTTSDPEKPTIEIPVLGPVRRGAVGPAQLRGKPAPRFELSTNRDRKLTNENGKPMLVNFFAGNCGFCKKQIPRLEAMRAELEKQGIPLVHVAETMKIPYTEEKIRQALKSWKIDANEIELAYDLANTIGDRFKILSYPTLVIIDGDGRVKGVVNGNAAKLETRVRRLAGLEQG